MKKLLLLAMSFVMVLSLCACGKKGASSNEGFLSSQPTEEENEVISMYVDILDALESYVEDGIISIYNPEIEEELEGSQALEYCYVTIQGLRSVDKWIGTDYISDTRTRKEILDSFTVVKDVKLWDKVVRVDYFGNPEGDVEVYNYTYNEKGEIVQGHISEAEKHFILGNFKNIGIDFMLREYFESDNSQYTCTYTEAGEIEVIQNKSDRLTPIYDNEGKITSMEYLSADGEEAVYSLAYDNQNRLSKMQKVEIEFNEYGREQKHVDEYNFIYDDNDNLIGEEYVVQIFYDNEKVHEESKRREYIYDDKGKMSSADVAGISTKMVVDYNNEKNIVIYNITTKIYDGNKLLKQETMYGDFYAYNPKK